MTLTPPPPMQALARDRHGRVVPWFVHVEDDGAPDFRVITEKKLIDAARFDLCWLCGRRRGRHVTFVVGPMCGVNRTSSEPGCHAACAEYAALVCPFLTTPGMVRRERDIVGRDDRRKPPGDMVMRNPGVTLLWTTRHSRPYRHGHGLLFDIGPPTAVRWLREGRPATRPEVQTAIEAGLPSLRELCERPNDLVLLDQMVAALTPFLPA